MTRSLAWPLVFAVSGLLGTVGHAAGPQAPLPKGNPPAPAASASAEDALVGRWAGSARLTSQGGTSCTYVAPESPPGVTLDIERAGDGFAGRLRLDLPSAGDGCPSLRQDLALTDVVADGHSLRFSAPMGQEWTLALAQQRLQGLADRLAGSSAAAPFPLAGEVTLTRAEVRGTATAAPTRKTKVGVGAVVAFLAANAAAAGVLVAVNQTGQKTDGTGGQVTCSPRSCTIEAVPPCRCDPQQAFGGDCGSTSGGVPYLGSCNVAGGQPCQAALTCNADVPGANGICEERYGRCPF